MYAITSCPFVNRTFATLRRAEFGFFGVRVITCTQTPRRCGQSVRAGDFDFTATLRRPLRISWLIVGMFGNKKPPRGGVRATKNPPQDGTKFLMRPDAVSAKYRGKYRGRKEYFMGGTPSVGVPKYDLWPR